MNDSELKRWSHKNNWYSIESLEMCMMINDQMVLLNSDVAAYSYKVQIVTVTRISSTQLNNDSTISVFL